MNLRRDRWLPIAVLVLVALAPAVPRALDGVVFSLDEVGELSLAAAAAAYGLGALALTDRARPVAAHRDLVAAATPTPSR